MKSRTTQVGEVLAPQLEKGATAAVDPLAGDPWRRGDVGASAVVGLAVMVLTFLYRTEIVPTDPWHYVQSALSFPSTSWVPLGYTRYGMILPVKPLTVVFGDSQVSYYFWPLLSAGVLAAMVYLLGRRWWGPTAGLLAVALLVSNSIVFLNLSRGYPDIMSTALFCVAVVFALLARDRIVAGTTSPVWFLLVIGFTLGWGFEARETSMLAWPLILLILWRRGTIRRSLLWVLLPLAAWAAVDIGIGAFAYGDPLLKVHTFTRQDLSTATNPADLAAQGEFVNRPRLSYLTVIPRSASLVTGGWWMLAMGVLATLGLFIRNKATQLMAFWFISVYVLFVGIMGMFVPAHPAGRLDVQRYWIQFFPAVSLAVAGIASVVAGLLAHRTPTRMARPRMWGTSPHELITAALAVCLLAVPTVSLVTQVRNSPLFAPNGATALQQLRTHLSTEKVNNVKVWTDWETARILPIYQKGPLGGRKLWSASFKSLTSTKTEPKQGDYVVLFSATDNTCPFCRTALKPWLKDHPTIPPAWVREFTSSTQNLTLYQVG